jgi:quinol monooxygenase YgiN
MATRGLLVRCEVVPGNDAEVEAFLQSAVPAVRAERDTTAWFAIRFGRSEYGIFDVFPDDAARDAHLGGTVAAGLMQRSSSLFTQPPQVVKLDVVAEKMPATAPAQSVTKALLLTFKPKSGHEADIEQFLKSAKAFVDEEPQTTAWFAIRLADGHYGIFDVFPDNGGRFAHLTGHVARELAKHALSLLGSVPDPELPSVIASKLDGSQP